MGKAPGQDALYDYSGHFKSAQKFKGTERSKAVSTQTKDAKKGTSTNKKYPTSGKMISC